MYTNLKEKGIALLDIILCVWGCVPLDLLTIIGVPWPLKLGPHLLWKGKC